MKHPAMMASVSLLCLVLLLGGISYGASDIPAVRDAKDSVERTRVQALIEGARKESTLNWTGSQIEPKHANYVIAGFKEYYGLPQLKVNYTYGSAAEIISRINQLIKAERTPPDIVWLVAWDWYVDLMKDGKLMRYDSPYYKEYTISDKAGNSMPGYWVSDCYTNNPMWNVKELEKRGIKNFNPTSWWDFVDPRLVPLTCMNNLATATTNIFWTIGMRRVLGDEWFIKLGKGKPAFYTKADQGERWVSTGEYPICLMMRIKNVQELHDAGLAVGFLWPKEGQILFPFSPVIPAGTAHPNTAKLFIDYMRSAPGVDRLASTGIGLIYGRPGVKITEKEKKFFPPSEELKIIPMDWNKETTVEIAHATKEWAKKIGIAY